MKPDLSKLRVPVQERAKQTELKFVSGNDLLSETKVWKVGVRGEPGVGKTFTVFSMLQDHVVDRADEDDWIEDMFGHNPALLDKVLSSSLGKRRSYLKEAHLIIFLDFDNLGAQPLIQGLQCHQALFDCLRYVPINSWEEAFKAMMLGIEMAEEHEKKWGKRGIWWVIDNARQAWSFCQADYVKAITGKDMNEVLAEARMRTGQGKEAARERAREISKIKDWGVINPSHNEEWLLKMVNTGTNIMILSPPTSREIEVDVGGGVVENQMVPQLGGAKNNPHTCHYIFRKFRSDDRNTFYADLDKSRYTGILGEKIANPTWRAMREEMERIEKMHLAQKRTEYNRIEFEDISGIPTPPPIPSEPLLPDLSDNLMMAEIDMEIPDILEIPVPEIDPTPEMPEIDEDLGAELAAIRQKGKIDVDDDDDDEIETTNFDLAELRPKSATSIKEQIENLVKNHSKRELVEQCELYGLDVKGKKKELATRILEHENAQPGGVPQEPKSEPSDDFESDDSLDFNIPDIL